MPTVTRETIIRNKLGLHARPAMVFVERANGFKSDIQVQVVVNQKPDEDRVASAKSIMQMLTLESPKGTVWRITATGEDAQEALDGLIEYVESLFGGEEE